MAGLLVYAVLPQALSMLPPLQCEASQPTHAFVFNAMAARAAGIDCARWLRIGLPAVLLRVPLMAATLWWVLRPQHRHLKTAMEPVPWTRARLLTPLVLTATALGWTLGAALLKALGIGSPDTVVALAALMALVVLNLVG